MKGPSALLALAETVAVVTVPVCRWQFQSVEHTIAMPISIVFNAARVAATASKGNSALAVPRAIARVPAVAATGQ